MEGVLGQEWGCDVESWPISRKPRLTFLITYAHVDSRVWCAGLLDLWICMERHMAAWILESHGGLF